MRELWLKIVYAGGTNVLASVMSFVSLILTAHYLGASGRGEITAITTWVQLFGTIGGLSLGSVILHRATTKRGTAWFGQTVGSLLLLTVLISLLSWVISLALAWKPGGSLFTGISPLVLLMGFSYLPFVLWDQYGATLLMVTDRIALYNRARILGVVIGFILLVSLLLLHMGVLGAVVAIVGGQIVTSLAGLRYLIRDTDERIQPDKSTIKEMLRNGSRLHIATIGGFVFQYTDVLVISHYRDNATTGIYSLAMTLVGVLLLVPQAAMQALSGKIAAVGPDEAWPFQRRIGILMMLAMCGVVALAALLSPVLIPLVVGSKFHGSIHVFRLLLFTVPGMAFSTLMISQSVSRGWFWQSSAITLFAAGLNFALNIALVPRYGMYGSIWATILSYYIGAVPYHICVFWWANRNWSRQKNLSPRIAFGSEAPVKRP